MVEPVLGPEELTAEWLTTALNAAGHDRVVTAVDHERIGTGQMGTAYRLRLDYEGAAGPASLVAKLPAEDETARTMVAPGYRAEVAFYSQLASLSTMRVPECWYVGSADEGARFTLLLEDLAPRVPGVQAEGCDPERARAAVANLVGLHAPTWNNPAVCAGDVLQRTSADVAEMFAAAFGAAVPKFEAQFAGDLSRSEIDVIRSTAEVLAAWQVSPSEPFAVIHGDYRLDNLLFGERVDDVVAVDLQTAQIGLPLRDVSYFLGCSLHPDDRRTAEEGIVSDYLARLRSNGVDRYGDDECWMHYRIGHLQGPMVTVMGSVYATGERSPAAHAMFLAMIRRSCAAITDLDTFDAL